MAKPQIFSLFRHVFTSLPTALRRSFCRVTVLAIVTALSEFVLAGAVSLLGVVLASPETLVRSAAMQKLLGMLPALRPLTEDPRLLLVLVLLGLSLAALLKTCLLSLLTWRQSRFSQMVSFHIVSRLYQGYMSAPYVWHTQQKISDLITILSWRSSIGIFLFNFLQTLSNLVVAGILFLSICCMTLSGSLLILAVTGTSAWLVFRFCRRQVQRFSREYAASNLVATNFIYTGLNGIRDVLIYQRQELFSQQFQEAEQRAALCQSHLAVFPPLPSWVLELVGTVLLLATVLILRWQGAGLAHISATLTLLAAVAWRLLPVMNRGLQSVLTMQQHQHMAEQVLEMLHTVEALPRRQAAPRPCPLRQELRLEHVSFRYPGTPEEREDALRDIDLVIPRGSMVGLVGTSGAGKSTLVNLLTGLYEPTSGQILVDGVRMDPALRQGWMRSIGYVPQAPFLLNGSIAENVAFSQWGEDIDRERVLECCRMAAVDFLDDLEQGVDTLIGDHGVRLSGGQLQRVSVARALYHRPQFLLFDEATSALDGASELAIQNTIGTLRAETTIVLIAHRLSTVQSCDMLYWMEKGRIRMQGSTREVLPAYEAYLARTAGEPPAGAAVAAP
ncbi:MAG TPA: ABC transporter ATP-binding protein/permease [Candidatus Desulfovibrio gallistercoris]|nr:ABC transporter ATP-binding protein/permease [Candidatus Desulfovibrio gallistercoris]